ncbi:amidohydrolase [Alteribacter populi]|uniref:amidohydrolase n=1 Tax=Alteribacter populi TaxID=2011011 RepID=UPI000BBB0B0C|nr:amidohydrolase [Alteribacter populi]
MIKRPKINVDEWAEDMFLKLVEWRRLFHQVPEVGWTEYVTTDRIYKELAQLGFTLYTGKDAIDSEARMGVPEQEELEKGHKRAKQYGVADHLLEKMTAGHTGVVAQLNTERPGPHIAFRFDIDALPIHEAELSSHFPKSEGFTSTEKGKMHACAHDGHTAIGLGLATFLSEHKQSLSGKFTLLFQPAEEGSRGAKAMVSKGWLDDVDWFLGGHIGIEDLKVGQIAATTNHFLATTKFDVSFSGVAAHAGKKPEEGKNALLAAATCAQHLHSISRHSDGTTRLNVGTLQAGTGRNIIPDKASMAGETRGKTNELDDFMFGEAKRIVKASAALYDVTESISVAGRGISADCDPEFKELVKQAVKYSDQLSEPIDVLPLGASEDVTHMMKAVQNNGGKATYLIFGTPLAAGHHHPSFDYDEKVLKTAVISLSLMLLEILYPKEGPKDEIMA